MPLELNEIQTPSSSFRNKLRHHYGQVAINMFRNLEKLNLKLARTKNHLTFLCKCKTHQIIPNFLRIKKKHLNYHKQRIIFKTEKQLVSSFIKDTHLAVIDLEGSIHLAEVNLRLFVDTSDFNQIICCITNAFDREFNICKSRQQNKLKKLLNLTSTNKRPTYNYITNNQENVNSNNCKKVINLSTRNLSDSELSLLKKGLGFSITYKKLPYFEIISSIEYCTKFLDEEKTIILRNDIKKCIEKSQVPKRNLTKHEEISLRALKADPNIKIVEADKGGSTVVMNSTDYKDKLEKHINEGPYTKLNKDPTKYLENKIYRILKKNEIYFKKETRTYLTPHDSTPPYIRGQPKVHKAGFPLRIIVSTIGSPTYNLSKYLKTFLAPLTNLYNTSIKNTSEFIDILHNIDIKSTDILASLDVKNMFPSIPVNETLKIVKKLLYEQSNTENQLPPASILEMLTVCLEGNYFRYTSVYYKQNDGLPMGNSLSPILANIYMDNFENIAIQQSTEKPKLIKRYVDDYFLIWDHGIDSLTNFVNHFNSFSSQIQFTIEVEKQKTLPFLDVMIDHSNETKLSVYRKDSNSGILLNYNSNHPATTKSGIIKNLTQRNNKISSNELLKKQEERKIINILKSNDYPHSFIKRHINSKQKSNSITEKDIEKPLTTITIPYIKGLSEKIRRINKRYNFRTVFSSRSTLKKQLVEYNYKYNKNLIYKIPCNDCQEVYIGQTGSFLETRLKQHKNNEKFLKYDESNLVQHQFDKNHRVNYNKTEILKFENDKFHRIFLESAYMTYKFKNHFSKPSISINPIWHNILLKHTL